MSIKNSNTRDFGFINLVLGLDLPKSQERKFLDAKPMPDEELDLLIEDYIQELEEKLEELNLICPTVIGGYEGEELLDSESSIYWEIDEVEKKLKELKKLI